MSPPATGAPDRSRPPAPGPLRPYHFPPTHRRELSNGLQVLVAEVREFPVVSLGMSLPASGMDEAPERAGVATLTADLLDAGAAGRSALEVAAELEGLGVLEDTGASWDATYVGFTSLRTRVEPASRILADLVRRPDFPQGELDRLRGQRLAAIAQRRADPSLLANEAALRFIFAEGTPYARPLSGTTRSLEALTREDVRQFHALRYLPAGATLLAAGDLSADEAVEIAEACFGDWAGAPEPSPAAEVRAREDAPGVVLVDRPGSVQAEVRVGQVGVARTDPDFFPLLVMNQILGGSFSSRLNLSLRERHGYTYGLHSSFTMRRLPGPFLVSTAVQSEATAASLREIFHEVRAIREAPVTDEELDDVRSYLAGVFPLRLETTVGIASRLSSIAVYGLPDDYFDHYRERILAVTRDDVLRVAREHLDPERMVAVVAGDAAQLRGPLEELGEVRVLQPGELEV
ncbi:MAG TPA: pitrilysin family protein [Longimicrobiaceae bacterium]|nr:pitrilysin family protein [Longimicrobiaceae bacterium]